MTASPALAAIMTEAVTAYRAMRRSTREDRARWLGAAADALDAEAAATRRHW